MKGLKIVMKDDQGFTLLEMVIVVLVIAALLLLFIPNISNALDTTQVKRDEALVQVVGTQAELYRLDQNIGPNVSITLSQLQSGGYLKDDQVDAIREMNDVGNKLSQFKVTVDGETGG